ncbi:MAG TPA: KH domain-containing protein [bacterium (Candidatus Stahlbacteria)]|nr:KH domain-containing protein [Candidatus Stahlbacteria bacterium]
MREIEVKGQTEEEALNEALNTLKAEREEVNYERISESDDNGVALRVSFKGPEETVKALIRYFLGELGFKASVRIKRDSRGLYMNIKTKRSDRLLIGKHGETLFALQYLISRIVRRDYPTLSVLIDVGGYRLRRQNYLRRKAEAVARIVVETGKEMAMDPLTEKERRIVEEVLKDIAGVTCYAIGTGHKQNVIIVPSHEGK